MPCGRMEDLGMEHACTMIKALGFLLRDIKKPPTISKQIIRHFLGPLKSKHSEKGFVMLIIFVAFCYQYT